MQNMIMNVTFSTINQRDINVWAEQRLHHKKRAELKLTVSLRVVLCKSMCQTQQ